MATINQLQVKIKAVKVAEISQQSIEETKEAIVERQKDQLLHGLNAEGQPIGEYKNPLYAEVKNRMNPLPGEGVPDLKLTGAFYSGINVQVTPDTFKTESTDNKAPDLEKKYGEQILGLDKENKSAYMQDDLKPVFVRNIRNAIGL